MRTLRGGGYAHIRRHSGQQSRVDGALYHELDVIGLGRSVRIGHECPRIKSCLISRHGGESGGYPECIGLGLCHRGEFLGQGNPDPHFTDVLQPGNRSRRGDVRKLLQKDARDNGVEGRGDRGLSQASLRFTEGDFCLDLLRAVRFETGVRRHPPLGQTQRTIVFGFCEVERGLCPVQGQFEIDRVERSDQIAFLNPSPSIYREVGKLTRNLKGNIHGPGGLHAACQAARPIAIAKLGTRYFDRDRLGHVLLGAPLRIGTGNLIRSLREDLGCDVRAELHEKDNGEQ